MTLSSQMVMTCNPFTEGCDGGWPLLDGYFAETFPIPLESCVPYKASTVGASCSDYAKCKGRVRVSKSSYVGGYYGATSEMAMMKEIRARGPISSDINCPLGFSFYKEGIFSDDHEKIMKGLLSDKEFVIEQTDSDGISKYNLNDLSIEWQFVNHSILVIGWGEEDGVKFWICRNSYGENFGE